MQKQRLFLFASVFYLFSHFLEAKSFEEQRKEEMIADLSTIKHVLDIGYAPKIWKGECSQWNLEKEFEKAKGLILSTPSISLKTFQDTVKNFLATTQDYHVDVLFHSTASSTLPFSIKGAEGRYFIDWIDTQELPASLYPIYVGDELIAFNNQPIAQVIENLKTSCGKNSNALTDQALAEMKLTKREGQMGDAVPQGPITFTIRSSLKGGVRTYQLMWKHHPELISTAPFEWLKILHFLSPFTHSMPKTPKKMMMSFWHQTRLTNPVREGDLGSRKSFVPALGPRLWVHDEEDPSELISWYAYIYETPEGRPIGYVRIPHYAGQERESQAFGELLDFFEENTDALVIDQVHNTGGFVRFQYEMLSMLTASPLKTPKHRLKITQDDVMTAYRLLKVIDRLQAGPKMQDDEEADDEEDRKELDYPRLLFFKAFFEFAIQEWNAGRTLTDPTHLEGVDCINPHAHYHYTKPILMLINELDFSGGDFVPAILQDNKRALLFGTRTAGAGGFVSVCRFPNNNGIIGFSYTGSIAERPNAQKIENVGVTPDIEYQLTAQDLQEGYPGYISAVNEAVHLLLQQKLSD